MQSVWSGDTAMRRKEGRELGGNSASGLPTKKKLQGRNDRREKNKSTLTPSLGANLPHSSIYKHQLLRKKICLPVKYQHKAPLL